MVRFNKKNADKSTFSNNDEQFACSGDEQKALQ